MEEYREFLYPRIVDLREVGMLAEEFKNVSLFNQGESSDIYDFFAYYRFIKTSFDEGKEEDIHPLNRIH